MREWRAERFLVVSGRRAGVGARTEPVLTMATPAAMVEEISKLSVEQLRQVKEQVDGEVSVLQDSLNNIRTAANRFEMASKSLNMLSTQPAGMILLPQ